MWGAPQKLKSMFFQNIFTSPRRFFVVALFEKISKKTLILANSLASQNSTFLEILTHCDLESYLKKETQQLIERLKADFPAILSVFFLHRKSRVGRNTPRAIILA